MSGLEDSLLRVLPWKAESAGAQEGALGHPQGWSDLHVPGGTAVEGAVWPVFVLANGEVKLVVFQVRGSTFLLPPHQSHRHPERWAGLAEWHMCPPASRRHPRSQNQWDHLRLPLSWHAAHEPGCCFFRLDVDLVHPGVLGARWLHRGASPVQVLVSTGKL